MTTDRTEPIVPHLSFWDAVSIILGIVIGSSIFRSPPLIASSVTSFGMLLWVWALGGLLSLVGAFCYAELASAYPQAGGDYIYLTRAFGPWAGFLFGWGQLVVLRTANIGAMAFVFGDYAVKLWNWPEASAVLFAVFAVLLLTVLNILGVKFGKVTQNILSILKIIGLAGIVIAGFAGANPEAALAATSTPKPDFGLAMILVLYAYGGWSDAAFVASELRKRRHIALALIIGTAGITVIYLAVNAAYVMGLGFDGVRRANAVAAAVLDRPLGAWAAKAMCILVMISALGTINGLIYTGSRVYWSLGQDFRLFALLGRWHPQAGAPIWSLGAQSAISLLMIAGVGTELGRRTIDRGLEMIHLTPLPWERYNGGFNTLVTGTAPLFWTFFLMAGFALFALRHLDHGVKRPFSTPLYPLLPLIFVGTCLYMWYAAVAYAGPLSLLGWLPMTVGLVIFLGIRR